MKLEFIDTLTIISKLRKIMNDKSLTKERMTFFKKDIYISLRNLTIEKKFQVDKGTKEIHKCLYLGLNFLEKLKICHNTNEFTFKNTMLCP